MYAPLWLGAIGAGGIVSGTNPASTVPELVHHFAITKPKYIIAQEGNFERIAEAARQCGIPADRIFILGLADELNQDPAPYRSWRTLLSHGEQEWNKIDDKDEQASTIALLGSTSGTTGLPKAAKISHRYLVAQCTMIQDRKRGSQHEVCQIPITFVKNTVTDISPDHTTRLSPGIPRFRSTAEPRPAVTRQHTDVLHDEIQPARLCQGCPAISDHRRRSRPAHHHYSARP